jgi:hypothetical protein
MWDEAKLNSCSWHRRKKPATWHSDRHRHRPDYTPPLGDCSAESAHEWRTVCRAASTVIFSGGMAVLVEMHHTGDPELQRDVVAIIEHVLSDRPGDWRVSIIGSQGSDRWEMKITGPNAFERSYTLERTAGEHEPHAIAALVVRIVPPRR